MDGSGNCMLHVPLMAAAEWTCPLPQAWRWRTLWVTQLPSLIFKIFFLSLCPPFTADLEGHPWHKSPWRHNTPPPPPPDNAWHYQALSWGLQPQGALHLGGWPPRTKQHLGGGGGTEKKMLKPLLPPYRKQGELLLLPMINPACMAAVSITHCPPHTMCS